MIISFAAREVKRLDSTALSVSPSHVKSSFILSTQSSLRIHYSQHVTNAEVRRRTGCLPLSEIIHSRRLNWFGHVAWASPELDHRRALYAAVHGQPRDWKRRRGRPAHTWTRTVEADLKPANIGLFSAWHRAQDWTAWSGFIRTAMPQCGVRS